MTFLEALKLSWPIILWCWLYILVWFVIIPFGMLESDMILIRAEEKMLEERRKAFDAICKKHELKLKEIGHGNEHQTGETQCYAVVPASPADDEGTVSRAFGGNEEGGESGHHHGRNEGDRGFPGEGRGRASCGGEAETTMNDITIPELLKWLDKQVELWTEREYTYSDWHWTRKARRAGAPANMYGEIHKKLSDAWENCNAECGNAEYTVDL